MNQYRRYAARGRFAVRDAGQPGKTAVTLKTESFARAKYRVWKPYFVEVGQICATEEEGILEAETVTLPHGAVMLRICT